MRGGKEEACTDGREGDMKGGWEGLGRCSSPFPMLYNLSEDSNLSRLSYSLVNNTEAQTQ